MRLIVLTASDIRSATVVNYIHRTTSARVAKIYLDTGGTASRPSTRKAEGPRDPVMTAREKLRYHFGLARRMPRHYLFLALERTTGVDELRFLYHCERIHPRLLPLAAGLPADSLPPVRPVLRTLAEICRRDGTSLVRVENLNAPETVASLAADEPDVLIGLGTRILSKALLKVPRIGTLNAHSSLLPDYRGGTTEFWQMASGEARTGITIHWMTPRVDEGDLCTRRSWPIPPRADHHRLRLMSLFHRLEPWREVIEALLRGEVPREPQGPARMPTFRHPNLRQQHDFYCLGKAPSLEQQPEPRTEHQPCPQPSAS